MPVTVLKKSTMLGESRQQMNAPKISETDRINAARAVNARRTRNDGAFDAAFDEAVTRYGGLERLVWVLADELAKVPA